MRDLWSAIWKVLFAITIFVNVTSIVFGQSQCDPITPSFTVDLTGQPSGVYVSPNVSRKGLCCGLDPNASPPIRCVEFVFTLDAEAQGIRFDVNSGAVPSGSLGYQINCGPYYQVGEDICLNGPGPHRLTFCKPGSNANTYKITSIAKPKVTPPSVVSDACSKTLTAYNFDPATVTWTSVPANNIYNSYLSCTSCAQTVVTYQVGAPPFIDYQVTGIPSGGCSSGPVTVSTRIYFVNDKKAFITPKNPTICFGGTTTNITANGSGGAPPYTYLWNTGATTQTIPVSIGKYWVTVKDTTSCPSATDTVVVTAFPSPILANAGPDVNSCFNNPAVSLSATVSQAKGGKWTGGNGTFLPSDTNLTATYTPSITERNNGTLVLTLTTTGNGSCPPVKDETNLTIAKTPVVIAGPSANICKNNPAIQLAGTVQFATGGIWSGGSGSFFPNPNTLNAIYTPTPEELLSGTLDLTLTSTGNGSCLPVSAKTTFTFTEAPIINAGSDQSLCSNNATASLNGSMSGAVGVLWTGGAGTFSTSASLSTNYIPTPFEIMLGSVALTMTSTGNGNCAPVSDEVLLNFIPVPTAQAGIDQTICTNKPSAKLSGKVTIANGGSWTGGTGIFSPSRDSLNVNYTPSLAEINNGVVSLLLNTTGNGGCSAVSDEIKISILAGPVVNAGPDRIVCSNNSAVSLQGTVTRATGGMWIQSGGLFSPDNISLNTSYLPSSQELAAKIFFLILQSTGNGACNAATDTVLVLVNDAPVVTLGNDLSLCANNSAVNLNGSVQNGGTLLWTGGAGTYAPASTVISPIYTPTQADITSGGVVLSLTASKSGCKPVSDEIKVSFTPAPMVNAGPDVNVCANNANVILNGIVSNATGGTWSLGTGIFKSAREVLNNNYSLSPLEVSNAAVTLVLTSIGNGNCKPVSDDIKVTVTQAPLINAGRGPTVCANNALSNLGGSISVATGVVWSGGGGTFSPNKNSLNFSYLPSSQEIIQGFVKLVATSTGNGNCLPVSDDTTITITPAPLVDAGPDQLICSNNSSVTLNGKVENAIGGAWSGGKGTFNPGRNFLKAEYIPTADELTIGGLSLTLTSTGNGNCLPVSDNIQITFTPAPIVDAGPDQSLCGDVTKITLKGSVKIAQSGTWGSNGTGTFTSNGLDAIYVPSGSDKTTGKVTFTFSSIGNGTCKGVQDNLVVSFTPVSIIQAGPDQTVCTGNFPVQLAGSGSAATWSGGQGNFNPDKNNLQAKYTPSAAEVTSGKVTLTLTTIVNGACASVSDQVTITIPPGAQANVGPDFQTCADKASIILSPTVVNAQVINWKSSGKGLISPNSGTANISYFLTAEDRAIGSISLILTAGNGICSPVVDTVKVTLTPAITSYAGLDQTICADAASLVLNGIITGTTGATWQSTGSGIFQMDSRQLNASYFPSEADKLSKTVTLTLVADATTFCPSVSSKKIITITPAPTASAGPNSIVCSDTSFVKLNAAISVATGLIWKSSGSGTFSPDATKPDASYFPSSQDKVNGTIVLSLTTTGNGTCKEVVAQKSIQFTPAPSINAGSDFQICSTTNQLLVTGNVTIATGGVWSTLGSGVFLQNGLNAEYKPSVADKTNGSVVLRIRSTGNGSCKPVSDHLIMTIVPQRKTDAGPDFSKCSNINTITLAGSVIPTSQVFWSSSGTGVFIPDNKSNIVTYTLSAADKSQNNLRFILTASNNSPCPDAKDTTVISMVPLPFISAGPDLKICSNEFPVKMNGIGSPVLWSGGKGTFSPGSGLASPTYLPTAEEINSGVFQLVLASNGSPICPAIMDTLVVTVIPSPIANAGNDFTTCADQTMVLVSGTITNATGGNWTSLNGGGVFGMPNALSTSFVFNASQIASGTAVIGLTPIGSACPAKLDPLVITIKPIPLVNAGPDKSICADASTVSLEGKIYNASGGIWKSTGTGTFSGANTLLSGNYFPSAADKNAGKVKLILTSTGNGTCLPVSDTMLLSISPAPTVEGGAGEICADETGANLSAIITVAGGVVWTSTGTGRFSPLATSLNTKYIPSASDISKGEVLIRVKTSFNGTCFPVQDSIKVSIIAKPSISAGADKIICADAGSVAMTGSMSGAPGVIWVSSGGGNFSNPRELNPIYTLSAADIASGKANLKLTTTGTGACKPISAELLLVITPAPSVYAGLDQTMCKDFASVALRGNYGIANGVQWTSNGSGSFTPNSQSQNTVYVPSAADRNLSAISFVLTTTQNGLCKAITDTTIVKLTPTPTVDLGPDMEICTEIAQVALGATTTIATGVNWKSTGTGNLTPSTGLITKYFPSSGDKQSGLVTFIGTSVNNGNCLPVTDTLLMTLVPSPIVDAGPVSICSDLPQIPISGSVSNADGFFWTSEGTGLFTDSLKLNTLYVPSAFDRTRGRVRLVLHSVINGLCTPVTDTTEFFLLPAPSVNAGASMVICSDAQEVNLNGLIGGTAIGGTWSTNGGGNFSNIHDLTAKYFPAPSDTMAHNILLTLNTVGPGPCNPIQDTLSIYFTPKPTIDAGPSTICDLANSIPLNAKITVASGITWSGNGTGTFTDPEKLNSFYNPSNADRNSGSVKIYFTTTGNGTCLPVLDSLSLNFKPQPTANAGPDIYVCTGTNNFDLMGSVMIATDGRWSTTGSGGIAPMNALVANYEVSPIDVSKGTILFILTSLNQDNCPAAVDSLLAHFIPLPVIQTSDTLLFCKDVVQVPIRGEAKYVTSTSWISAGSGGFTSDSIVTNYIPSSTDRLAGEVLLTLRGGGIAPCAEEKAEIKLIFTPTPVINAGPDVICSENTFVDIYAYVTIAAGVNWTTDGSGIFVPNQTSVEAIYIPSNADRIKGIVNFKINTTGNGTCQEASKSLTLNITPPPAADAGEDKHICADQIDIELLGKVSGATGWEWTSSGTGDFTPANIQATSYTPSIADKENQTISLILHTTGTGICLPVTDTLLLEIEPQPLADAGDDMEVCPETGNLTLKGMVQRVSGGVWSTSGAGNFSPDVFSLEGKYNVATADVLNGQPLTLVLTTMSSGLCEAVSDTAILSILPQVKVFAGGQDTTCEDYNQVFLNGKVLEVNGAKWSSSGSGSFLPDATSLAAVYQLSPSDITGGQVNLTLTSDQVKNCQRATDVITIHVTEAPAVSAGPDMQICANQERVLLNGAIQVAKGGKWRSSGTGIFQPSDSVLNATYVLSPADQQKSFISLTLISTENRGCLPAADTLVLKINPVPIVQAGNDIKICADKNIVQLQGSVLNATSGSWNSSGTGTFVPDAYRLDAAYIPSLADKTGKGVSMTFTSDQTGCVQRTDTLILLITPAPEISAGNDFTICSGDSINLNATKKVALALEWTTSGTGIFTDSSLARTMYIPSKDDIESIGLIFTAISRANGSCNSVSDQVLVNFQTKPIANAGPDQRICKDNAGTLVRGIVTNASGLLWNSSGSGTFVKEDGNNGNFYKLSEDDLLQDSLFLIIQSTDNKYCKAAHDSLVLYMTPLPTVEPGSNDICAGNGPLLLKGTITFAGGGVWSSSGSGYFEPDPANLDLTYLPSVVDISNGKVDFTLTSTSNGLCKAVSKTKTAILLPLPLADAGRDATYCRGEEATLTPAQLSQNSYSWYSSNNQLIQETESVQVHILADTNFVMKVKDGRGCISSDTIAALVIDAPGLHLPPYYCFADNLLLNAAPTDMPPVIGTFVWFRNDTMLYSSNTSSLLAEYPGLHVTTFQYDRCVAADTTEVRTGTPVMGLDRYTCIGNQVTLRETSLSGANYTWTNDNTVVYSGNSDTLRIPLYADEIFYIDVHDSYGCLSKDTIQAYAVPPPVLTLENIPACQGDTVILHAKPTNIDNELSTYKWFRNKLPLPDTSSVLRPLVAGLYKVNYVLGECMASDSSLVAFHPLPVGKMTRAMRFCKEDDQRLLIDAGIASRYLWEVNGDTTRTIFVDNAGTYQMKIFNEYNCSVIDSIVVKDICPPKVFIPNAISPGKTGDDRYKIFGRNFINYSLTIFNRWGEIIFYSENKNELWDGTYRGEEMPIGVYNYILRYEGIIQEFKGPYQVNGTVTIVR